LTIVASVSFSSASSMASAHENLNGSPDLTTPLSGMLCHPWASTYYDRPIYQRWTIYLHPLRRYERRWFGV